VRVLIASGEMDSSEKRNLQQTER